MTHLLHSHTPAHETAKTATRAAVKRSALAQLVPSDDPDYGPQNWQDAVSDRWNGPLFVGYDGIKIEL